jgi:hypothetical protein
VRDSGERARRADHGDVAVEIGAQQRHPEPSHLGEE